MDLPPGSVAENDTVYFLETGKVGIFSKINFCLFNLEPISHIPNALPCEDLRTTSQPPLVPNVTTKPHNISTYGSLYTGESLYTNGSPYTTESRSAVAVEGSRMLSTSVIVVIAISTGVAAVIIGSAVSCYISRKRRFNFSFCFTTRFKVNELHLRLLFLFLFLWILRSSSPRETINYKIDQNIFYGWLLTFTSWAPLASGV